MRPVIGHREILSTIPNPLPPTLLLTGPEGVGKRRVAHVLAYASGAKGPDLQVLGSLDRAAARNLIQHHMTHPLTSPTKTSVADLTRSSPEALNSILKILESPPEYSRIILHTDVAPLLTIRSRCFGIRFGLLSTQEVAQILQQLGIHEGKALNAAQVAHGRVSVALEYVQHSASRRSVEDIQNAFQEASAPALERALNQALSAEKGESHADLHARREMVARLLSLSLRESLINPDHPFSVSPQTLRLEALKTLENPARAALKIRSALWILTGAT